MNKERTELETSPLVLVVDDDKTTRFLISTVIRSFGCVVDTAGSVKQAIECLEHRVYDLILIDGHLGDGCGSQIARSVRHGQFSLETPIIAITSDDDADYVQMLLASGVDRMVRKPISAAQIRELAVTYGLLGGSNAAD